MVISDSEHCGAIFRVSISSRVSSTWVICKSHRTDSQRRLQLLYLQYYKYASNHALKWALKTLDNILKCVLHHFEPYKAS